MNLCRNLKLHLLIPLLFAAMLLSPAVSVSAQDEPAAALPSSGLPELPNYTTANTGLTLAKGTLPSQYDSRDEGYVTSVKSQDPWGACWAFGALSAGESSLIKKGLADTNIDLSEMHLAYFFFKCPTDPLGLTSGDTVNNYTGSYFLNTGGNNIFTMFALSKWLGAASESLVPYSNTSSISSSYAYKDTAHMQNARFVNSADSESVKNLIMEYGSVSTAIYYHSTFQNSNGAYMFPYTGYSTNHIVTIVGWDDSYSRNNFSATYNGETIRPDSDGAWIAKNSYGTSVGDEGYIYISYEDVSFVQTGSDFLSYAFDMESANNYDQNYQYDGSFGSIYLATPNGTSIANVYTIEGDSGGNERLDAVSFSVLTQNVEYSIQVYKNPTSGNPTSGSPVFSSPQTGQTTYSGYYTIPLNKKIVFAQGDSFSVVITLNAVSGSTVQYFVDRTSSVSGLQFVSNADENQSFCKSSSTSGWVDLYTLGSGTTARIKAFTTDTTKAVTKIDVITSTLKRPVITYLKRVSATKVKIKWKTVKNAKKYEIYRSKKKNGTYRKIATVATTSYTDTSVVPGATYYYKIRARRRLNGAAAYSKYSKKKSVTVKLSTPTLSSVKYTTGTRVRIKWKKVTGAQGYEVYRSSRKKKGFKKIKTCTKNACINVLSSKKTYYYKVRAYTVVNGKKVYSAFSSVKSN